MSLVEANNQKQYCHVTSNGWASVARKKRYGFLQQGKNLKKYL